MTDPFSYFPSELVGIIFTFVNFRVINIAKRFHTNPETVYAFFSIVWGIIYALVTTPFTYTGWDGVFEYAMSFGSKISLIGLATSGVWHRYKQFSGKTAQDRMDDVATGVAAGITIAEQGSESGVIEVQSVEK